MMFDIQLRLDNQVHHEHCNGKAVISVTFT